MVEGQAACAPGQSIVHRALGRRVAPADLLSILAEVVLRIVDNEVGPGEELDMTKVLPVCQG